MREVRAALILVVFLVHGLYALPWPNEVSAKNVKLPEVAEELDTWHNFVAAIGIPVGRQEFEDLVVGWSKPLHAVHPMLKKPFGPFMKRIGNGQAWALFASPDQYPHRLMVEGRVLGGPWEVLFLRHDPDHTLLAEHLRYRRLRGIYDGAANKGGKQYKNFTKWVARKVVEARPELDEVRIQLIQTHTTLPGEPIDPKQVIKQSRIWKAESL